MTTIETLLLACLHQDPTRLTASAVGQLRQEDWEAFLSLAHQQFVRPLVCRRLSSEDVQDRVPAFVLASLKTAFYRNAVRNLALHAEAAGLVRTLADLNIPVILLKGMHLATAVYGNPSLREIGDIDLMVPRDRLADATAALLSAGYSARKPFDIEVDAAVSQHVTVLFKPPRFAVEVHWNLTEPHQPYTIAPRELWERASPLQIGQANAQCLSTEDLVLHLCLHLAYQHRFDFGLRSLCDVAHVLNVRFDAIDWAELWSRAERWGWNRGVALGIRLATTLLGAPPAPIPDSALPPSAVLQAASMNLLRASVPDNYLPRGLVVLSGRQGVWHKARQLIRTVARPADQLRRQYPRIASSSLGWPFVYIWRCGDLIHRHLLTLLRLSMGPRSEVHRTAARHLVLESYLESPPRD